MSEKRLPADCKRHCLLLLLAFVLVSLAIITHLMSPIVYWLIGFMVAAVVLSCHRDDRHSKGRLPRGEKNLFISHYHFTISIVLFDNFAISSSQHLLCSRSEHELNTMSDNVREEEHLLLHLHATCRQFEIFLDTNTVNIDSANREIGQKDPGFSEVRPRVRK